MPNSKDREIVIIGAGIIGLDVAYTLAQQGYGKHITVVAEHLPGDLSINYTSPWAGANFSAISDSHANALRWDQISYPLLLQMADDPSFPYVSRTESFEYWDVMPPKEKIESMASYLENYKILPASSLPQGAIFGITFTTITFNAPAHTAHLQSLLQTQHSIPFLRHRLPSLSSVSTLFPRAKLVFNCVGGAAETFPGVQDKASYPTRGQILVARVPGLAKNIMQHGRDYETYIIPRPNSGGQVILGGYMQKGVRTGDVFGEESASIKARTGALAAGLLGGQVEIVAACAGLRPSRVGGARIEKEVVGGTTVVHDYGAGGTGFQAGMGMALDAVALARPELEKLSGKSKL